MSRRRTVALGVAAWLVVVTAGAGLVWAVISRAGEGVASSAPARCRRGPTAAAPADPTATRRPDRGRDDPATGRQDLAGHRRLRHRRVRGAADRASAPAQRAAGGSRSDEHRPATRSEVEFETRDERTRIRVEAACRDGVPVVRGRRNKG